MRKIKARVPIHNCYICVYEADLLIEGTEKDFLATSKDFYGMEEFPYHNFNLDDFLALIKKDELTEAEEAYLDCYEDLIWDISERDLSDYNVQESGERDYKNIAYTITEEENE